MPLSSGSSYRARRPEIPWYPPGPCPALRLQSVVPARPSPTPPSSPGPWPSCTGKLSERLSSSTTSIASPTTPTCERPTPPSRPASRARTPALPVPQRGHLHAGIEPPPGRARRHRLPSLQRPGAPARDAARLRAGHAGVPDPGRHGRRAAAAPPDEPREGSQVALVSALLFAVHPLQTQAVTYVVQRYTSLATAFYLGAVVLYLASRTSATAGRRWAAYAGALLWTVLAMRTKEIAFTIPFAVALFEGLLFRGPAKGRVARVAPFLLGAARSSRSPCSGPGWRRAGPPERTRRCAPWLALATWRGGTTSSPRSAPWRPTSGCSPPGGPEPRPRLHASRNPAATPTCSPSLGLAIVLLGAAAWAMARTRAGRGGPLCRASRHSAPSGSS